MAYDEELADRAALSLERSGTLFETKKMMGGLCFMVDDKMALGVVRNDLMVRLSPEEVEAALDEPGCRPMDFTGKPLKGFLFIEAAVIERDHELDSWVERALVFNPLAKRSKKR